MEQLWPSVTVQLAWAVLLMFALLTAIALMVAIVAFTVYLARPKAIPHFMTPG